MSTGNIGIGLSKRLISSILFGPSFSYGEANDISKSSTYFWGFGFILKAQAYFIPLHTLLPGVGLGIDVFYNLTGIKTKEVEFRNIYSIRVGVSLTNIHI